MPGENRTIQFKRLNYYNVHDFTAVKMESYGTKKAVASLTKLPATMQRVALGDILGFKCFFSRLYIQPQRA